MPQEETHPAFPVLGIRPGLQAPFSQASQIGGNWWSPFASWTKTSETARRGTGTSATALERKRRRGELRFEVAVPRLKSRVGEMELACPLSRACLALQGMPMSRQSFGLGT